MALFQPAFRLTLYAQRSVDPTEATILTPAAGAPHSDPFQITTLRNLAGWKPYLGLPKGRRGRLDFLTKRTDTGEIVLPVLDVKAGSLTDNLTRWLTAFFGDVTGRVQTGFCKGLVEMSLSVAADGTRPDWAAYWTGRLVRAEMKGRQQFDLALRDMREDMVDVEAFVGRPAVAVTYAQLVSVMPVGILKAYGTVAATKPLQGTIGQVNSTLGTAAITLKAASKGILENILTRTLLRGLEPNYVEQIAAGASPFQGATSQPHWGNPARLHLKRLDTSAEGDFQVGLAWTEPTNLLGTGIISSLLNLSPQMVHTLAIKPLDYPKGVATGTPLVNHGGGYAAGSTSIATDGWTISITGILKAGDIISFAGHATRYQVTVDANSDGSGNATLTIQQLQAASGGLTASVADNEAITVQRAPSAMALPPATTDVEFSIVVDERISEENPLLVNDVDPLTFWQDLLNGYYGQLWKEGEPLPPGKNYGDPKRVIAFDASVFTAIAAGDALPVLRAVITEAEKLTDVLEKYICKPYGLSYYFDGQGRLVPVDLRTPLTLAGVPTLTDSDLVEGPPQDFNWIHDPTSAITAAVGTRYLELFTQPVAAKLQVGDDFPRISAAMFEAISWEWRAIIGDQATLGEKTYEIDAIGVRAMPRELIGTGITPTGTGGQGIDRSVWTLAVLQMLFAHVARPYGKGPSFLSAKFGRTGTVTALKPGGPVLLQLSGLVDPSTNKRGGTRLARVLEYSEDGYPITLRFLDLGLNVFLNAPTLGTPAQLAGDTAHSATVSVTLADGQAEIWYAVTDTATGSRPADTSSLWTRRDLMLFNGTFVLNGLPPGARIWLRARTVPDWVTGPKLPSAWAYGGAPGYVDLAALTAPSAPSITNITGSTADLSFTIGDAQLRTMVGLASPTSDPPSLVTTLVPGQKTFHFEGLANSTSYRVTLWHIDNSGGKSASVTVDFTTTGTNPTCPAARACVVH